jgi:soluble lytic murein transglycosylase
VLENLRVYRQRLNEKSAPLVPATADATSTN